MAGTLTLYGQNTPDRGKRIWISTRDAVAGLDACMQADVHRQEHKQKFSQITVSLPAFQVYCANLQNKINPYPEPSPESFQ